MTQVSFLPHSDRRTRIEDQFYPQGKTLRDRFVDRFARPLQATSDRFCWDYWVVPEQYRLLRAPAEAFFGKKLFDPFLNHLLHWGRKNLGCQMVSHPWLSAYVDGCFQALHSDVPHGPWSFVYSLTPWKQRKFSGGETLLAHPKLLNYFEELRHDHSHESIDFLEKIPPLMNRLTLFDPRYPHGVERVQNVQDLSEARVVIHGWFTEPRPMIEGALSVQKASKAMDAIAQQLIQALEPSKTFGLLSVRFQIARTGKIETATVLSNHLIDDSGLTLSAKGLNALLKRLEVSFPQSSGTTELTLPIEFKK